MINVLTFLHGDRDPFVLVYDGFTGPRLCKGYFSYKKEHFVVTEIPKKHKDDYKDKIYKELMKHDWHDKIIYKDKKRK